MVNNGHGTVVLRLWVVPDRHVKLFVSAHKNSRKMESHSFPTRRRRSLTTVSSSRWMPLGLKFHDRGPRIRYAAFLAIHQRFVHIIFTFFERDGRHVFNCPTCKCCKLS